MAIESSKLQEGTLKLGTAGTGQMDASCQVVNCRVTSSYSDAGDTLTALCGDTIAAGRKLDSRQLAGTLVQDFNKAETAGGIGDYLWNHELEEVPFEFVPNQVGAPTITGTVTVEVPGDWYGGDIGASLTADFAWNATVAARTYA
jgi:hypothetical protein